MVTHKLPDACKGERCQFQSFGGRCEDAATHKVEEAEVDKAKHPPTAYLCCFHFAAVMGPVVAKACGVE